jgi:hypothetical protein
MIGSVPDAFLRMWDRRGMRPESILVASQVSRAVLCETAEALGVPIVLLHALPALDSAMSSVLQSMGLEG